MAIGPTYKLTIDLAGIDGQPVQGVTVSVELAENALVYPLGTPTETLLPTVEQSVTNAQGIAKFNLLPSSEVGNYIVTVGGLPREIEMPARDVRLSALGDPVTPDNLPTPA